MQFLETSAKNSIDVEDAFMTMTRKIKNRCQRVPHVMNESDTQCHTRTWCF